MQDLTDMDLPPIPLGLTVSPQVTRHALSMSPVSMQKAGRQDPSRGAPRILVLKDGVLRRTG